MNDEIRMTNDEIRMTNDKANPKRALELRCGGNASLFSSFVIRHLTFLLAFLPLSSPIIRAAAPLADTSVTLIRTWPSAR